MRLNHLNASPLAPTAMANHFLSGGVFGPAYFAEQGIDLSQYSTNNTVRDAIASMDYLDTRSTVWDVHDPDSASILVWAYYSGEHGSLFEFLSRML